MYIKSEIIERAIYYLKKCLEVQRHHIEYLLKQINIFIYVFKFAFIVEK